MNTSPNIAMDLRINSITKLTILLALRKNPMHGYGLMDSVQTATGIRPGPAQIYPFLSQLSKKKYVKAAAKGARDKTVYELTAEGKRFTDGFTGKMGVLLEGALATGITECTHCSCKIFGKPYLRKIGGHEYGFCCPHCAENFLATGGTKSKVK